MILAFVNIKYVYLNNAEHTDGAVDWGTALQKRKVACWNGCT